MSDGLECAAVLFCSHFQNGDNRDQASELEACLFVEAGESSTVLLTMNNTFGKVISAKCKTATINKKEGQKSSEATVALFLMRCE